MLGNPNSPAALTVAVSSFAPSRFLMRTPQLGTRAILMSCTTPASPPLPACACNVTELPAATARMPVPRRLPTRDRSAARDSAAVEQARTRSSRSPFSAIAGASARLAAVHHHARHFHQVSGVVRRGHARDKHRHRHRRAHAPCGVAARPARPADGTSTDSRPPAPPSAPAGRTAATCTISCNITACRRAAGHWRASSGSSTTGRRVPHVIGTATAELSSTRTARPMPRVRRKRSACASA